MIARPCNDFLCYGALETVCMRYYYTLHIVALDKVRTFVLAILYSCVGNKICMYMIKHSDDDEESDCSVNVLLKSACTSAT